MLRFPACLLILSVIGCASTRHTKSSTVTAPQPNECVTQQVDTIRGYATVHSVAHVTLTDGESGWMVTYTPHDKGFIQDGPEQKWIKLREATGYVAEMSPEFY